MNIIKKPRGIFYGWWIVVASFLLFFLGGGTVYYGFSAFFKYIITEMRWSRTQTSLAFSLKTIVDGIVMPFVGFFVDRIGARRCIFTGIVIMGIGFLLISRISSLLTFYASMIILQLGNSLSIGIPEQATIANWFRRRRSRAIGIVMAGAGFSGIMTPLMVYLIHAYGWRQSLAILSLLVLIVGLPLSLVMRQRPEPYGYLPDGDKPEDPVASAASTNATTHSSLRASQAEGLTVRQCLSTRTFWLLIVANLFAGLAPQTILVHEILYFTDMGISENIAALTITGITVSSLVGRLGFGWLGDLHDKKRMLIISFAMETVGVFIFANIRTPLMIIPFLLFYGPGFGGMIPLMPAIVADCFGTKSFASIQGVMGLGMAIPGVIGPFVAGWLYDALGDYYLCFTAFAILCSLAIPVVMLTPLTPVRARVMALEKTTS